MASGITPNPDWERRVRERAKALGSDGCTAVSEWNQICCLHHDIMCRTHMDIDGNPVTREEADHLFRECNRLRARLGLSYLSPRSWVRYVGVRLGAWWDQHGKQ